MSEEEEAKSSEEDVESSSEEPESVEAKPTTPPPEKKKRIETWSFNRKKPASAFKTLISLKKSTKIPKKGKSS